MSDASRPKYRIVPSSYFRYRIERKGWLFWSTEGFADDINKALETIRNCGGELAYPPLPSPPSQEGTK